MDLHKGMRVLGICLGTGGRSGSRSYAVAVTEEGAIKDHMILPPTYGPDDSLQVGEQQTRGIWEEEEE